MRGLVHCLDRGEALLGPLPNRYTLVPRFEPSRGGYVSYYLDRQTQESFMCDPSIAWEEFEVHPPMSEADFVTLTASQGEPLRRPRSWPPDFKYIRHHGVPLKEIEFSLH